jgi:hypothetical protein
MTKLGKHLLLKSCDGKPEDEAWSAPWHSYDDLVRRAAYHALASDDEWRKRMACVKAAEAVAASIGGSRALSIEQEIVLLEEAHR